MWRVYFCPACTSIQSDTLKLPALSISAIVALDHLRGLRLLLIVCPHVRLASRNILGADHPGSVDIYVAQDIESG